MDTYYRRHLSGQQPGVHEGQMQHVM
uniref:Uncharacterized protein n=1 Tax=Oryza barthii TaxID=65489 RepID=A0A0D3HL02_9ORYZ